MQRWAVAAAILSGLVSSIVLAATPTAASASGISVKVTPDQDLTGGQTVTIRGHGLAHSSGGKPLTWFVTECTTAVRGRMNPSTDTPHCDVTTARAIDLRRNGTFSSRFRVMTGIIGDGYCGTAGHPNCVIGVGTAEGQGTVVRISFRRPAPPVPNTTPKG